jgi:2',3'-cyclic-nucleotide 2'-phosphodiesterase (5'-nucleotidase family)
LGQIKHRHIEGTEKDSKKGLARIFTKVKEIRSNNKNTLLVDSGDFLQGTPLVGFYGMNVFCINRLLEILFIS